jgi:phosphoglycerol transferase MdoB-like AlkP superfamily enzyme
LPELLKEQGYATSFYHGAKEGSMNFKSFTKAIGVTSYVGLESYPQQSHFDGNWGVWDHQMLPFFGRELGRAKQPFFSALFTLSSHHPYKVPAQYEKRLKAGPEPLCRSIAYTDLSLRQFFKRFQNKDWFKNTLFVITADHVGPTCQQQFQTLDWRYRIPIAFYHPSRKLPKPLKNLVFQQIDIMPTVLDLLGFKKSAFQLGSSCYDPKQRQKMVYDNGNLISFIRNGSNLVPVAWTPFVKRKYTRVQHQMSKQMSALYQFYMNSLIENHCARQTIK